MRGLEGTDPQHRDLVLAVGHQQRQPGQGLLQVLPQDLHPLSRVHLLVLLILVLERERGEGEESVRERKRGEGERGREEREGERRG